MALTHINMATDNWSEPWVPPVRAMEGWETESCACDKVLEQNAQYLVRPWTNPKPFTPASRDQIAMWESWIASPEAAQAIKSVSVMEADAKHAYSSTKFDPVHVARQLNSMFPKDLEKFQSGSYMRAFNIYKMEQLKLLDTYVASSKNIKTSQDYDVAEKAYKTLSTHVNSHGDIIMGVPIKQHKKPNEATASAPTKVGRRATRRATNEAEMNESSKTYTAAEMRRLARGLPAVEESEEEA